MRNLVSRSMAGAMFFLLVNASCEPTHEPTPQNPPSAHQDTEHADDVPAAIVATASPSSYPWLDTPSTDTLGSRFAPPGGYQRVEASPGGFSSWLRGLPLKTGRPDVMLHDGTPKQNQAAHLAVIEIDKGNRDLQQCADAVIRLRGEYLFATDRRDAIAFNYTSGDRIPWKRWAEGDRPRVNGNTVTWSRTAGAESSHANFRRYMDNIFIYAGSASLSKELRRVDDPSRVEPGDVFIQGGFPGHAVIVVDVAEHHATGARVFMLAQSFMPAQDVHILRNPGDPTSPWYPASSDGELHTPEWAFTYGDLKRFK